MILFFDTETSGLPDFGKVFESHNVIVKPMGWTISKETCKAIYFELQSRRDDLVLEGAAK